MGAKIALIGLPGCGKTSVAEALGLAGRLLNISLKESVGYWLSPFIQSELGDKIRQVQADGWKPLPDELAIALIEQELIGLESNYWTIEGFPRTAIQAQWLKQQVPKIEFIWLDIAESIACQRMRQRGDSLEQIEKRLKLERDRFAGLVKVCQPIKVDASKSIHHIAGEIASYIGIELDGSKGFGVPRRCGGQHAKIVQEVEDERVPF